MQTTKTSLNRLCWLFTLCLVSGAVLHAEDKIYLRFTAYDNTVLQGSTPVPGKAGWVEAKDFTFKVEQTLNIGSQSSGAGAGKITFNPFSFTLVPGSFDPKLFELTASATALKTVEVEIDRASGSGVQTPVEQFTFKLVAVKSITWLIDPSSSKELRLQVVMEYGGLLVSTPQKAGDKPVVSGWDRTKNLAITQ